MNSFSEDDLKNTIYDEDNSVMQDYANAQFLVAAPYYRFTQLAKIFSLTAYLILLPIILLFLALLFGNLSYSAPEESFLQAMYVELAAGIVIFLATVYLIPFGLKIGWFFNLVLVILTVILGFLGTQFSGVTRIFLAEFSVGFLLISALELCIKIWIEDLGLWLQKTKQSLKDHESLVKEAEFEEPWYMSPKSD